MSFFFAKTKSSKIGIELYLPHTTDDTEKDIIDFTRQKDLVKYGKTFSELSVISLDDNVFSRDVEKKKYSPKSNNDEISYVSEDMYDNSLNKIFELIKKDCKDGITFLGIDNKISILIFDNGIDIKKITLNDPIILDGEFKNNEKKNLIKNIIEGFLNDDNVNILRL